MMKAEGLVVSGTRLSKLGCTRFGVAMSVLIIALNGCDDGSTDDPTFGVDSSVAMSRGGEIVADVQPSNARSDMLNRDAQLSNVPLDLGLDSTVMEDASTSARDMLPDARRAADTTVSDSGRLFSDAALADMALMDAVPENPVDIGLIDDPLSIDHAELFRCDEPGGPTTRPRIWRLSRTQYSMLFTRLLNQPYPDILGVSNPFDGLHSGQQFSNPANGFGMDEPTFDLVMQSAGAAADYLTSQQGAWRLPECATEIEPVDNEACWRETLIRLSTLAWRRPASADEIGEYMEILRRSAAQLSHAQTIKVLINAVLVSPHTLFRSEIGDPDPDDPTRRILRNYELADALNYAIRDQPPSERLLMRVSNGELETNEQVRAAVDELLEDAAESPNINRFFREFFGYAKANDVFKDPLEFPDVDQGALVRETNHTIASLVRDGGSLFEAMLLSRRYVEDVPLSCPSCSGAEELGIPGETLQLDAQQRSGILTHPSWLIAFSRNDETDPVGRGYFIRERLLCTQVPSIPVDVIPQLPDGEADQTMREKLSAHSNQDCIGCHQLMDPLGLTFEMFDHIGEYQLDEHPEILPSGLLTGSGDADGPVRDAVALSERLARSERAQQCHVRTSFRYWSGRNETLEDACTIAELWMAYVESDGDFREMLTTLMTADTWRYRQNPIEGGDGP